MRTALLILTILIVSLHARCATTCVADTAGADYPRYAFLLESPRSTLSGILILSSPDDDGDILGTVFNEFGFTALSFKYNVRRESVKLLHVTDFLNKWNVRYVIKRDLARLLIQLPGDSASYHNPRQRLTYTVVTMQ